MEEITHRIIGMAMEIHRTMGCGYLESVYHNAMVVELSSAGIPFESKKKLDVFYKDVLVGQFEADLVIIVNKMLIIELKAVERLLKVHETQLVNYLTATGIEDGLLLNFGGTSLEIKRKFKTYRPSLTKGPALRPRETPIL
ncbi:MAG: GxxExxY protein [Prosthecobacter sp.]|nr:GxxExxY protein [Prosthecobacter sp.]